MQVKCRVIATIVAAMAVLMALAACQGQPTSDIQTSYKHVSGDEAARIINEGNCVVVDVRTDVDYDLGHIPGAILIPYDQVTSADAQKQLPDKNQQIVVYCDYGGVSKNAAEDLAAAGYTNVIEFDGLEVWDGDLVKGSSPYGSKAKKSSKKSAGADSSSDGASAADNSSADTGK